MVVHISTKSQLRKLISGQPMKLHATNCFMLMQRKVRETVEVYIDINSPENYRHYHASSRCLGPIHLRAI